jgi:carbamoyltransferase
MSPPLVLAIHEDTNANAALVRGNEILAAVAEERLSRVKYQPGFPARAVDTVLRLGGVDLAGVDAVVAGNRYHFLPRLPFASGAIEGEHDLNGIRHRAWLSLQSRFRRGGPVARAAEAIGRRGLQRRFRRAVDFVDHHTAHAWSAYLTSPFDEALAVSVDNVGDGCAARCFQCRGGTMELLWSSDAAASPGQFYGEIAQALGFHVLMAGKVTGLAARGDPRPAMPLMEELFSLNSDGTTFVLPPLWTVRRGARLRARLAGFTREDVCAAAQARLEQVLVAYVQGALRETGLRHVVLAGGVFANVLVNHRLWQLPEVDGLFVHPAMSDQGIAAGAALGYGAGREAVVPAAIPHVYLGPAFTEDEMGRALEAAKVPHHRSPDVEREVADAILAGEVVGRFTGAMEYGPRALGHRSILYHTTDPTVNTWLNQRLNRSEFMPFAPATLAEEAAACYAGYGPGVAHTARFMTITFPCTEFMRRASPAVVHIDGTARPQVVHEDTAPGFHRIIGLVHEATGVPSVINTSFNMHGEPIVATPEDAVRSFLAGRLDVLALGPFVARAPSVGS